MATSEARVLEVLREDSIRSRLTSELDALIDQGSALSANNVGFILGQWFHPLHYFPVFLSRLIAVSKTVEAQTFISKILWQELGQGNPSLAHEKIYIDTMTDAGFDRNTVTSSAALGSTAALVSGYEKASSDYLTGLGFLYGTEVADLAMVSSIGKLVGNCTGQRTLPWVDIHVEQEPDHVETSCKTLMPAFSTAEQSRIVSSAEEMWNLWIAFFAELKKQVLQ